MKTPLEYAGVMHLLAVQAISTYRHWAPGDLAFQGGTSLHLAYGSPRLSEDLDFIALHLFDMEDLARKTRQHVHAALLPQLPNCVVECRMGKAERNPHTFSLSLKDESLPRTVMVKVEFYVSEWAYDYRAVLQSIRGQTAATQAYPGAQSIIPVATLSEILVDKVHAIACRQYVKARDWFDLWWISKQGVDRPEKGEAWLEAIDRHARMYGDSASAIADGLSTRIAEVDTAEVRRKMIADMAIWLPSFDEAYLTQALDEAIAFAERIRGEIAVEVQAHADRPLSEGPKP